MASDFRCLEQDATLNLRKLRLGGVERPLGIVVGAWASPRFISNVMLILLNEVLFIETVISAELPSSIKIVEALAAGVSSGNDFSVEVWNRIARDVIPTLDPSVVPVDMGAPGFDGFEGLFVRKSIVQRARQVGHFLTFYLTYGSSLNIAGNYFDSYVDVAAGVTRTSHTSVTPCAEDAVITYATATAEFHLTHTGDSSGVTVDAGGTVTFSCSGPDGAVWLSPACRLNHSKCIPIASSSGWGFINNGLSQKYVFGDMAVGVFNFKGLAYRKAPTEWDMPFYSWVPDATFAALDPVQVSFPAHNPEEWNRGVRASSQGSGDVRKMVRAGLEADVSENVWLLIQRFMISMDQVNEYLKMWPLERDPKVEFEVACSWVKSHNSTWDSWKLHSCPEAYYAPADGSKVCFLCPAGYYCPPITTELRMRSSFQCPAHKWCPNGTASPQTCLQGSYLIENQCLECLHGKYTEAEASTECLECASWLGLYGGIDDRTGCSVQWGRIIAIIGVLALLVFIIYRIRKRLIAVVDDRPDRYSSFSGSWVNGWIGISAQERLVEPEEDRVVMVRSSNSDLESAEKRYSSSTTTSISSSRGYCCCCRCPSKSLAAYRRDVESKLGIKKARQLLRRPDFIVNATPFFVHVSCSRVNEALPANTFAKVRKISRRWMRVVLTVDEQDRHWQSWMPTFQGELRIQLEKDDWEKATSCRGGGTSKLSFLHLDKTVSLYDNKVIRWKLPVDGSSEDNGQIKLVWRRHKVHHSHGEVLLLTWSPPHTLRGMPIHEFVQFLDKVIEHKGTWLGQMSGLSGHNVEKTFSHRNMYDANKHLIDEEATCYDSSYAEVRTFFGPADIFISHVWAETALNTKLSLVKVVELLADTESKPQLLRGMSSCSYVPRTRTCSIGKITRVWFCTCCNNQARIAEELGSDVQNSPFARVLRSTICSRVILVSPLKALERKWCNYEFSLAVLEGKEPLMVTKDGVVQAGQVPPKYLKELSQKIVSFTTSAATCSSQADEELIDRAVLEAGGYAALDMRLKKIFHQAIINAHEFTAHALHTMETHSSLGDHEELSQSELTPQNTRGVVSYYSQHSTANSELSVGPTADSSVAVEILPEGEWTPPSREATEASREDSPKRIVPRVVRSSQNLNPKVIINM